LEKNAVALLLFRLLYKYIHIIYIYILDRILRRCSSSAFCSDHCVCVCVCVFVCMLCMVCLCPHTPCTGINTHTHTHAQKKKTFSRLCIFSRTDFKERRMSDSRVSTVSTASSRAWGGGGSLWNDYHGGLVCVFVCVCVCVCVFLPPHRGPVVCVCLCWRACLWLCECIHLLTCGRRHGPMSFKTLRPSPTSFSSCIRV
jgi:hypothetical protein